MESFLFQQHNQPFLLDCVYNYVNQNGGDLSNNSPCYTAYTNNSSDANHNSSSSSLSTPQFSSEKKRKHSDHNSYSTTGQSKGVMGNKSKKKKQNGVQKKDKEEKQTKNDKELSATKAKNEEPKLGYIHVRARRGQATDSHSLAERVRRERISDRMKKLQDLVPGCDKVIGKALVLDEIINYVQSLQNQVEFLSMKLASANPVLYDFGGEFVDRTMQQEEMGSISHSMPSVIQGNHIQTTAYEGAINSLQQAMYGQGPSTFPQDSGSILMQIGIRNIFENIANGQGAFSSLF